MRNRRLRHRIVKQRDPERQQHDGNRRSHQHHDGHCARQDAAASIAPPSSRRSMNASAITGSAKKNDPNSSVAWCAAAAAANSTIALTNERHSSIADPLIKKWQRIQIDAARPTWCPTARRCTPEKLPIRQTRWPAPQTRRRAGSPTEPRIGTRQPPAAESRPVAPPCTPGRARRCARHIATHCCGSGGYVACENPAYHFVFHGSNQ